MNLLQRIRSNYVPSWELVGQDNFLPWMTFGGTRYPIPTQTQPGASQEEIHADFTGIVRGAYQTNGIVAAVELARVMLFAQARFQYRRLSHGRPGDLFGNASLAILEHPWPQATTGDLLTKMLLHADLGGDAFPLLLNDRIRLPRPDWVTVLLGSESDPAADGAAIDADLIGIVYHPGGYTSGNPPQFFRAEQRLSGGRVIPSQFAHFCPMPDPLSVGRGTSWMIPVIREVMGDLAASDHKLRFFEHGATPNMVVSNVPGKDEGEFKAWVKAFKAEHEGGRNSHKTLFLQGATTATVVGANMEQLDFRSVQGAGEVRICNAGGVPATVVGVSEGLQGSSLNAGNFASSMRRFADLTARPLWQNAAGSLEVLVPPQAGSQLWYDDRDIPALKDDIKDRAEVQKEEASSINQLVTAGYKPDAIIDAILAGDWSLLKGKHSGLFSVQLQPPASKNTPTPAMPEITPPGGTAQ